LGLDIFGPAITSADFQSAGMRPFAMLALKMERILDQKAAVRLISVPSSECRQGQLLSED
jgi:hypothetical protein